MSQSRSDVHDVFLRGFLGGLANAITMIPSNPLDVLKIRFQTSGELVRNEQSFLAHGHRLSMWQAARRIAAEEGVLGLWKGLSVSMLREMTFSSTRLGLYEPIKRQLSSSGSERDLSLPGKITAGVLSGAIAATLFNPTDVLKVRFQADRSARGQPRRYCSIVDAVRTILRTEGLRQGLYKGAGTTTIRAAVLTGAQLSSYDQGKHALMRYAPQLFQEGVLTHLCASFFAGVMTTLASNPIDVARTRIMNERGGPGARYRGPVRTLALIVRQEGPLALYKGFVPSYLRLGSCTVLFLVLYEQLRRAFGIPGI